MTTTRDMEMITLAEKVMGWTEVKRRRQKDFVMFTRPNACNVMTWHNAPGGDANSWNPYNSIADAWMLVDALRKRDLWFKLVTPWTSEDHEYSAGFTEFGTVDCGSSWVRGRGPTAHEAICAAALMAVKFAQEPQREVEHGATQKR